MNVPSSPVRPSALRPSVVAGSAARARLASGPWRWPRSSIACARRSPAGSRRAASGAGRRRARPSRTTGRRPAWRSLQPRLRIAVADLGRGRPPTTRPWRGRRARGASFTARSRAVQHSTFEERWWRGSPRHLPHALRPRSLQRPGRRVGQLARRTAGSPGAGRRAARGSRWMASSSSPYTSSWVCSHAPLPTRTGVESRHPRRCGSSRSLRSCSPPIPYMICSECSSPAPPPDELVMNETKFSTSSRAGADVQGLQGQAGVADPRVAIVPVALAADGLRQRGRRRRDDGTGRAIRECLEHPRAEPHEVAVGPCIDVVVGLPTAPAFGRVGDAGSDVGGGRRGRIEAVGRGPAEGEADLLALSDGERRRASCSPRR